MHQSLAIDVTFFKSDQQKTVARYTVHNLFTIWLLWFVFGIAYTAQNYLAKNNNYGFNY